VKYHDFVQVTRAVTLSEPTDDGGTVYRCALDMLLDTDAGARPVRLLGISVSKLVPAAGARKKTGWSSSASSGARIPEPEAPGPVDPERKERLNRAVDRIRAKFGPGGIAPGALPREKREGE